MLKLRSSFINTTAQFLSPTDEGDAAPEATGGSAAGASAFATASGEPAAEPVAGAAADPVPAATTDAGGEAGSEPAPVAGAVPKERFDRVIAERWTERRRAEAAENALRLANEAMAQMRTGAAAPAAGDDGTPLAATPTPVAPTVTPERLQSMAAEIAANQEFNNRVTASIAEGRKSYTDFDAVASKLSVFGDFPRPFVEALLETGKGADVLYALGNDAAEADRIFSLSPIKQAIEVERYASKVATKAAPRLVSAAPRPIAPKTGATVSPVADISDPNLSMADFIAMREKQVAANPRRR